MLNRKSVVFLFVLIQRPHLGSTQRFFPHSPYGQFRGPVFSFPHGQHHDNEYASRRYEEDFPMPEHEYMNEPGEGSCPAFNQAFSEGHHSDQDETFATDGHQDQCRPPPQFFAGKSGFSDHPFGNFRQAGPFPFPFPQPYPFMVPFPSPQAFWFPHPNRPPGPFGYGQQSQNYRAGWPDEKAETSIKNRTVTTEKDDLRDEAGKGQTNGRMMEKCSEMMVSDNTESADIYRILSGIQRQLRNLHGYKEPQSKFGFHLRKALSSVSDLLRELDVEDIATN